MNMLANLTLTDGAWMNLIDAAREGLPRCCANVSALRDVLIDAARESGEVLYAPQLQQSLTWYLGGHDYISTELQQVIDQCGWSADELRSAGHNTQSVEIGVPSRDHRAQEAPARRAALEFLAVARKAGLTELEAGALLLSVAAE